MSRICSDSERLSSEWFWEAAASAFLCSRRRLAEVQWPRGQPRPASGDQRKGVRPSEEWGPVTSNAVWASLNCSHVTATAAATTTTPNILYLYNTTIIIYIKLPDCSHPYTVSLIKVIESVFKYSFGIRILWNLNWRKSLHVLYTAYSPLNSIRFWTVIRSHNLAALLCTVSSQYKLQTQPGPCTAPAAPGFRSHMSAATGQRKQFIELTAAWQA